MKNLLDAFWRAVAYCLHPRVMFLSLLPLVLMLGIGVAFALWGWWPAVDAVRNGLEGTALQTVVNQAADWVSVPQIKTVFPALLVIFAVTPLIVLLVLMAVAWLMMPALVNLVARRRFPDMERKQGASLVGSVFWSLGHVVLALLLLVLSIPLWLVPPLVLVLPPLIWGWLTYRVMAYDALAVHASKDERRAIMRRYRLELLLIGVVTGLLGAAPGVVWASAAVFAVAFAVLIPVAVWIYTLVFAFSALWFSHFCLAALQQWRIQSGELAPAASDGALALDAPDRQPEVEAVAPPSASLPSIQPPVAGPGAGAATGPSSP